MLKKYRKYYIDIYSYIVKRIEIGVETKSVAQEVMAQYKTELLYYDVSPEMRTEFVMHMCKLAHFARYGEVSDLELRR